ETTVKSRLATCIDHCRMMLRIQAVAALPMVFFFVKIKDKMLAIAGFIHELRNYHFGKEEVTGLKKHGYYYYAPVGLLIKEEHKDLPKRISEDSEEG
ncbi:MAG: hypothetical protein SPL71_13715, partial [Oribacterium sp.]|nr:hypothetical protein [Oribacterium sp.]